MDRLAASALTFTAAFVQQSVCSPSRNSCALPPACHPVCLRARDMFTLVFTRHAACSHERQAPAPDQSLELYRRLQKCAIHGAAWSSDPGPSGSELDDDARLLFTARLPGFWRRK
jgi:hypothetical protein